MDRELKPTPVRRARRYRFVVNIELTDLQSEIHLQERTADLGLYGCRVVARKAFSAGTKVRIRITDKGLSFAALGKVVYVAPDGQMGIILTQVERNDQTTQEKWINELRAS